MHVWFSCFDSFNINTTVGDFTVKHRPRNSKTDKDEWTFYYDRNIKLEEYHKDTNYYLKHYRNYLLDHYNHKDSINNNLVLIKSIRDILERNNIKKYFL